jgi:hypothetical protein
MALGFVIAAKGALRQVVPGAAAFVTVEAPFLLMALAAVVAGLAGKNPVTAYEVRVMVRCDTFGFVTGIALTERHGAVFGVSGLLFGIRLLLEAD